MRGNEGDLLYSHYGMSVLNNHPRKTYMRERVHEQTSVVAHHTRQGRDGPAVAGLRMTLLCMLVYAYLRHDGGPSMGSPKSSRQQQIPMVCSLDPYMQIKGSVVGHEAWPTG